MQMVARIVLLGVLVIPGADDAVRVTAPVPLVLPRDHGMHPGYRTEWWYFTGNVEDRDHHHYGFQLTFFRSGVVTSVADRASRFAVRDLWFAHFAITDVASGAFFFDDRADRGSLETAGAAADRMQVWLRDWRAEATADAIALRARSGEHAIALRLEPRKPAVLHGDRGFSRKGAGEGNATMYVSLTRCAVSGTITTPRGVVDVTGGAWMDHEFGSQVLSADQVGWDWFSVQLDDGAELMLFHLRKQDGTVDVCSSGTLVRSDGSTRTLARDDFAIQVLGRWTSARSGGVYPARWRLEVPSEALSLLVTPRLADQELRTSQTTGVTYWEGSCAVTGEHRGSTTSGDGYAELVGYAGKVAWF